MQPKVFVLRPGAAVDGTRPLLVSSVSSVWDEYAGASDEPVFVLCTSRSGSTLLRFLLDAHPDLACPPEFRLPTMCAQLTSAWSAVAAGVRHTMDLMLGPYLAQRGKKRYCNKDLGTAAQVDDLLRIYPEAKFICLYRHPMDMIASGVEACPWGLNNYGFEPYIASSPGNSVLAIARYWTDNVTAILAVEERLAGQCHRVRYEDLVADPETVAGAIFDFLGVERVPDISAVCFSLDRERAGPGDYKIWTTSGINSDSVGRGWSIPAHLIPEPATATLNDLAGKLGYVPIDGSWGTANRPPDLRLPVDGQVLPGRPGTAPGALPSGARLLGERIQTGLPRIDAGFSRRWADHAAESVVLIAMAADGQDGDAWWRVDLAARRIVAGTGGCTEDADWSVAAPAEAWEQVIRVGTNLGVAFRRSGMRYHDKQAGSGTPVADVRVAMMSELLGMQTWQSAARDG
jgi:hypothetical protein